MAQTLEEVYRGVMGQTLVVKLLPLHFNKVGFFGKAIVITAFIGKKKIKTAKYIPRCAVISENNQIENRLARRVE